jgi:hypothetical protein
LLQAESSSQDLDLCAAKELALLLQHCKPGQFNFLLECQRHWTRRFRVSFEPGDSSAVAQEIAATQGAFALTSDLHFDDTRNLSLTSLT